MVFIFLLFLCSLKWSKYVLCFFPLMALLLVMSRSTTSATKVLTVGFIQPGSKFIFVLYVLALVIYGSLHISLGGQVLRVVMLCRVRSHLVNA